MGGICTACCADGAGGIPRALALSPEVTGRDGGTAPGASLGTTTGGGGATGGTVSSVWLPALYPGRL